MFDGITQYIKDALSWFFWWIVDTLFELILPIIETLGEAIPDGWKPAMGEFLGWLPIINCWVPLDVGLSLLAAYYGIKWPAMAVKWILKAIPGIWG